MNYAKIIELVYEARKFVFDKEKLSEIKNKNPYDFVTQVDTSISTFLKSELKKAFPEVGFVTEEESEHKYCKDTFILDPIDGTTNLIYDYKMSAISLAYAQEDTVCFGVVYNPFSEELFFGIKDKGSYLYDARNGVAPLLSRGLENYTENKLKVSDRAMPQALIEFGASSSHKEMADETFACGSRVFKNCLDLRRTCCTAMATCYIAAGRLDGYFERIIKPWDFAAGCLILSEAGGRASQWDNTPLPLDRECTIVCSNGIIHNRIIELIH